MSDYEDEGLPEDFDRLPLHFFWLVDRSSSMTGDRINSLNQAIKDVLPEIVTASESNAKVDMYMRAIAFASGAQWYVGPEPDEAENFVWVDISTGGGTDTASAIDLLSEQLEDHNMPDRGAAPVCILISDGYCTNSEEQYNRAITKLNSIHWGSRAIRIAIGVGNDYSEEQLAKFGNQEPDCGVLNATNSAELIKFIKWASVTSVTTSSKDSGGCVGAPTASPLDNEEDVGSIITF